MSKFRGTVGSTSATNGSSRSLAPKGRFTSSVNAFNVFSVFFLPKNLLQGPGGRLTTLQCAQCSSRPRLDGVLFAATSSASCCCSCDGSFQRGFQQVNQPPALNLDTLSCNLALGTDPPRAGWKQPGKQEEELPTLNFLHAVTPCATLQNLLQTHLLVLSLRKPHPNSPRPVLSKRFDIALVCGVNNKSWFSHSSTACDL